LKALVNAGKLMKVSLSLSLPPFLPLSLSEMRGFLGIKSGQTSSWILF